MLEEMIKYFDYEYDTIKDIPPNTKNSWFDFETVVKQKIERCRGVAKFCIKPNQDKRTEIRTIFQNYEKKFKNLLTNK